MGNLRLLFIKSRDQREWKAELKLANEDEFFRGAVVDLLFGKENHKVVDKIFDPLFMEATV